MIQLNTPYTHVELGVPKVGTLVLEVASWQTYKDAVIYNIEDFIQDENGAKQCIGSMSKRLENKEYDQYYDIIKLDFNYEALTGTEKQWKEAQAMLMLITKYDLVDGTHTRYNALPEDWELCPE
jgi:hypothetical protein